MGKTIKTLNETISGCIFDSPKVLEEYSTDASELKITPTAVAFPRSTSDIVAIVKANNQLSKPFPLTVRGSGTSETGSCLSTGLIISTQKLDSVLDINVRERLVRVQPGITLKELNKVLSVHGLYIPVFGHDNSTLGGLISSAPVDPYSAKYHGITNYINQLELILPSGNIIHTRNFTSRALKHFTESKSPVPTLYRELSSLIAGQGQAITAIKKDHIGLSGYPSITKVKSGDKFNLLPLFFGAEGTLGIITEITLRAISIPSHPTRALVTFPRLFAAQKFIEQATTLHPRRLDLYDLRIFRSLGKNSLSSITDSTTNSYAIYLEFDHHPKATLTKLSKLQDLLPSTAELILDSQGTKPTLDKFNALESTLFDASLQDTTLPFFKNLFIPTWNLSGFINDLELIENGLKLSLPLYGSFLNSTYHLFPIVDSSDPLTAKKLEKLTQAISISLHRQGGSLAGGAPEGRTKAPYTDGELSPVERLLYFNLKTLFDPKDIMNPGVKLRANPAFISSHVKNPSLTHIHAPVELKVPQITPKEKVASKS